jgi:hypothetical protein
MAVDRAGEYYMSNNVAQSNKTVQTVETASATNLLQGNKTTQTVGKRALFLQMDLPFTWPACKCDTHAPRSLDIPATRCDSRHQGAGGQMNDPPSLLARRMSGFRAAGYLDKARKTAKR